jgi:hypothetical protein
MVVRLQQLSPDRLAELQQTDERARAEAQALQEAHASA